MSTKELDKIIAELYVLEPDLKHHEETLKKLLLAMSNLRPDTKFDSNFAAQLKNEILNKTQEPLQKYTFLKKLNFNTMNKKIYFVTGTLALSALAIIAIVSLYRPAAYLVSDKTSEQSISALPAEAFGQLASTNNAQNSVSAVAPIGLGGGGMASGALAARSESVNLTEAAATPTITSDFSVDAKMILPYFSYRYEYKGEPIELTSDEESVFRRLKGNSQSGKTLAGLLRNFSIPDINLKTFSNLRATNLSLMEDKDLGLIINFDFNEDNIYISENWEKWRIPERENCGEDQACWNRWRLKISDVPSDTELIATANKFLSDKEINLKNYGEPVVDNAWRENYDQTTNKDDFYIPEYATIIYPLIINNESARDQGGAYAGLRVNINLFKKAVSGLSGLHPYRFESSSYKLETSADNILKVAENGGWNRGWFGGSEETKTLDLGTPKKSYVQWWRYNNGRNDELFVPALIFPILNPPTDNYYGPRQIVVPLVKEMLDELNSQAPIYPMPVILQKNPSDTTVYEQPATDLDQTSNKIEPFLLEGERIQ